MSELIRVTKEFNFEMAHALTNYDGPCRNIHGHSYRLFVTIYGSPSNDPSSPKNGMVIDFNDLKDIVKKEVINVFDHAVVVSESYGTEKMKLFSSLFSNTVIVNYQPTCENLVIDFAARIRRHIPGKIRLHSLRLYETTTSYAEWYASDNE